MKLSCVALLLLSAAACYPKAPPAPAPTALRVDRAPTAVVQIAARQLVTAGFEITTSDTAAGVLTAKRKRDERGNFDLIGCRGAKGSIVETNRVSTVTVNLAAASVQSGSDVTIVAKVLSQYPKLTGLLAMNDNETDCSSLGVIEKQIADAIRAP